MIITSTTVTRLIFSNDEKKKGKCNVTKKQLVGYVPEPLTKILYSMMKECHILSMKAIITGKKQRAPEDTWGPGGGIELACIYHIYAARTHKTCISENLENEEKN